MMAVLHPHSFVVLRFVEDIVLLVVVDNKLAVVDSQLHLLVHQGIVHSLVVDTLLVDRLLVGKLLVGKLLVGKLLVGKLLLVVDIRKLVGLDNHQLDVLHQLDKQPEQHVDWRQQQQPFVAFVVVVYTHVASNLDVPELMHMADTMYDNSRHRCKTHTHLHHPSIP